MFVSIKLEDTITIAPDYFKANIKDVLVDLIDQKYCNTVMVKPKVGLCLFTEKIISIADALIYPGDGSHHVKVVFKLVVFRPQMGETMEGYVEKIDKDGIHVTLGFFNNITIPMANMKGGGSEMRFTLADEEKDNAYTWLADGLEFVCRQNDHVRFRIRSIKYTSVAENARDHTAVIEETERVPRERSDGKPVDRLRSKSVVDLSEDSKKEMLEAPMVITGSIEEEYLGISDWWDVEEGY